MITISSSGSFKNLDAFLSKMKANQIYNALKPLAVAGVNALSNATPRASGETANSWDYEIKARPGRSYSITWVNTHIVDGRPIAILLQYGHGTGTGGYVEGRDYINPAIKPIMDKIADEVWKAVSKA